MFLFCLFDVGIILPVFIIISLGTIAYFFNKASHINIASVVESKYRVINR